MNRRSALLALVGGCAPVVLGAATFSTAPEPRRGSRVSLDKNDPGYDPYAIGYVEVRFNGQQVTHCITADEELGMVVVWGPDFDKWRAPGFHEMYGTVRIRFMPGHPKNPIRGRKT